jgi:hypothetical protein
MANAIPSSSNANGTTRTGRAAERTLSERLGSTDSIQLEQRSQEGTNRLPRCLCGGCIVADMWVALDAFVLISEGAVSRSVSQPARFVLAYATSA